MGSERTPLLIDTNVFVIDLRYRQDTHYRANRKFLDAIGEEGTGFTTIVNLLEICGILSFNLNDRQLRELWVYKASSTTLQNTYETVLRLLVIGVTRF